MEQETIQGFHLAPQQRHLWGLRTSGEDAFVAAAEIELPREIDAERLQQALRSLVERHEVLRTSYRLLEGMTVPLQVVLEEAAAELTVRELDGDAGEEAVRSLGRELAERSFDLERGPLLRATLVRRPGQAPRLLFALPGLATDAAGLAELAGELGSLLRGEAERGGDGEEPLQYIDLSEWQNELLEAEDTEAGREFWRQVDVRRRFAPRLPTETRNPASGPFRPRSIAVSLELSAAQLDGLVRETGADLEAVFLAAWQLLLGRSAETGELVVGVGADGRRYEELQGVPGLLARSLPVATNLAPGLPFAELARAARQTWDEARSWQEAFTWNLLASDGDEDPSAWYCPYLFEIQDDTPSGNGNLLLRRREVVGDRFHLRLTAVHQDGGIELRLGYDPLRFEEEVARILLARYRTLLAGLADRPAATLGELEIVSPDERRLLETWSATEPAGTPPVVALPALFEEQVARTPDATAVVAGEERLTYSELAARAHRLARHLRAQGVGREDRVGICLERSTEMVTAVLAALEAGAGYVPMDPSYPSERLAFLAEDARVAALVTRRSLVEALPDTALAGVAVVLLDDDAPAIAAHPATVPEEGPGSDHLAYVIYTSGSTGRPKGVLVAHRHLVASIEARRKHYREPVKAFLLLSSFSFDSSVAGLFWTLCEGGALVLPPDGFEEDLGALVGILRREGVSHLLGVPSLYSHILESAGDEGLPDLRLAIVAGEACGRELVRRHFDLMPQAELHNEYGPTEATVWSTVHPLGADEPAPVAIGRPIAGARVHLLDPRLRAVGVGATGEILIAGSGVTRGYLARPALTAERFVPDPLASEPGGRLYRTGDLARYRSNGELEFLGRRDHQVKIRGFRVELGEIEAMLSAHPDIAEAAVVAPETAQGERRLAAYIVAASGAGDTATETPALRAFLGERLPEHLVPSVFIALEALPRTVHGKVDHTSLPSPEEALGLRAYVAPRTATEETVAEVWAEILGADRVSADGDFFELGGHSLAATQAVARLREIFEVELAGRSHFENPCLSDLAALIDHLRREGAGTEIVPLVARPEGTAPEDLPLSFAQNRLWLLDQLDPGSAAYNIPTTVRLHGPLDTEILGRAVSFVVRRHEVLRTAFVSRDGEPRLAVAPEIAVEIPVHDLSELAAAEREARVPEIALEEIRRPFDLAQAPLLRLSLIRTGVEEHVVLLVVHHIVADGWSMGILVREIIAAYRAGVTGEGPEVDELPLQYADYAAWQRSWLDHTLETQLAYWRRQLAGLEDLELPTDHPRPPVQVSRGKRHLFEVASSTTEDLRALGRSARATLFMVLLAAFDVVLRAYTGRDDIAVGTNVANRERPETQGLVGFFVNQVVLRTAVEGGLLFRELVSRVKKTAIEGFAHQDVPFEKLVEELRPERRRDRHLIYQVKVELQNAPPRIPEIPGVSVRGVEVDRGVVRYDLHLYFEEREGGLVGSLQYDSDLFKASTIETMTELTLRLLERVAEAPDVLVDELTAEVRKARKEARAARRKARRQDKVTDLRNLRRPVADG